VTQINNILNFGTPYTEHSAYCKRRCGRWKFCYNTWNM